MIHATGINMEFVDQNWWINHVRLNREVSIILSKDSLHFNTNIFEVPDWQVKSYKPG